MTLTATPAARQALDRRKLESRLQIVTGRAEALPQLNLGGLLSGALNRLNLLQFTACADILDDVDDRIERHMAAVAEASEQARAATLDQHLAENQGIETFKIGSVRSRDGWRWLKSKPDRLSAAQIGTGDRFASTYSAAHRDTLSTSANDNGSESKVDAVDALRAALQTLGRIAKHIEASTGSERLFDLLCNVCGRGETLRALAAGDDRRAGALEVELRLALDMAGVAFKMKREDAA